MHRPEWPGEASASTIIEAKPRVWRVTRAGLAVAAPAEKNARAAALRTYSGGDAGSRTPLAWRVHQAHPAAERLSGNVDRRSGDRHTMSNPNARAIPPPLWPVAGAVSRRTPLRRLATCGVMRSVWLTDRPMLLPERFHSPLFDRVAGRGGDGDRGMRGRPPLSGHRRARRSRALRQASEED